MTFPTYNPPPMYSNPYPPRVDPAPPYTPQLPQMQQMQQMPQMQQGGFLKGRPVTSEEEARGIPVDFDGSVMVFPDPAHGMIYTKQLNVHDGSAIFRRYMLTEMPPVSQPAPSAPREYAEKQEVAELRQIVAQLQAAVDAIPRKTNRRKDVSGNDEPDDADPGDR